MGWTIEFARSVETDLEKIGPDAARRIIRFLRERVAPLDDPRSIGEALHGPELGRFWKYRVGNYRIIASIQDKEIVILIVRSTIGGTSIAEEWQSAVHPTRPRRNP